MFILGSHAIGKVWWWWAIGRWWWWLVLVVVNGVVAWWKGGVVVCHRLVATSHLVGVKNEAGRVVVPA